MKIRNLFTSLFLSVAFATVLIIGSGRDASCTELANWNTPEIESDLTAALQGWVDAFGLMGGAMRVYSPGRLDWSAAVGQIDVEAETDYALDTQGRIASCTKPFTATLILQLIDEGLLSLDTTLDGFLPWYMSNFPYASDITVEHLLRHRSGIRDVQIVDLFFVLQALMRPDRWFTPEDILRMTYGPMPILSMQTLEFMPREPVGEPGEMIYHYSQPGYCALGMIIEHVTGDTLADVYDERIIEPLGLVGTHLPRKDDPLYPPGYTNLFGLLNEKIPLSELISSGNAYVSSAWSAGGMISTAGDLVTFLEALLGGELCSAEALALVQDWMPNDSVNSGSFGYGLGLHRSQHDGYTTIGHGGDSPGCEAIMTYIEELDTYVGAVTNTDLDSVSEPCLVERVWTVLKDEE
jgi:D-alanyl-D-alanine carboxypeptidase